MTIMRKQRRYWKIFDPNQLGECPDWIRVEASLLAVVLTRKIDHLPEPRIFRSDNFSYPCLTQLSFH